MNGKQKTNKKYYKKFIKQYQTDGKHSFNLLVKTMLEKEQQHLKGHTQYEMTITIRPNCKHKTYGKLYYASPTTQYLAFKEALEKYTKDINLIAVPEFHKNGNIHLHLIISHKTTYQIHLQEFRKIMQRRFGRTTLTEINSFKSYAGYVLKDINKTGINPIIINTYHDVVEKIIKDKSNDDIFLKYIDRQIRIKNKDKKNLIDQSEVIPLKIFE